MNDIDEVKRRIRNKKYVSNKNVKNNYVNGLLCRLVISVVIFLGIIVAMKTNDDVKSFVYNKVLGENISFSKISNLYNKYFGSVIPIKSEGLDAKEVFSEKLVYDKISAYHDGYELRVKDDYLVPIIKTGIVVFIGEKDTYGKTVIIQGIDEVEYWYSNIEDLNVSLYDYVENGTILGKTIGDKLYLTLQKNGEYLGYDEVME